MSGVYGGWEGTPTNVILGVAAQKGWEPVKEHQDTALSRYTGMFNETGVVDQERGGKNSQL